MKAPAADELAAIAAALAIYARRVAATTANDVSGWTLAIRRPELEFDELLVLRHSCSKRS